MYLSFTQCHLDRLQPPNPHVPSFCDLMEDNMVPDEWLNEWMNKQTNECGNEWMFTTYKSLNLDIDKAGFIKAPDAFNQFLRTAFFIQGWL